MDCCLAAALLISWARRAWRVGRGPAAEPFPPRAARPAPGTMPVTVPRHVPAPTPAIAAGPAGALAVLAYVGTATWLGDATGSPIHWLARDLLWAAVVAAILLTVHPSRRPREGARAVAVAGATWSFVMLVDAHLLGRTFSPVVDATLHLLGFAVTVLGLTRWLPAATTPTRQGAVS